MKKIFFITLIFLTLFLSNKVCAYTIKSITVEGTSENDLQLIKRNLGIKEGDVLNFEKIKYGLGKLYRLDLFDNIKISTDTLDDSINLKIIVQKRPRLKDFSFEGNNEFNSQTLKDSIKWTTGELTGKKKIFNAKSKILQMYHKEGYLQAQIKDSSIIIDDQIEVIFKITENEKVRVKKIIFNYNNNLDDDKLKGVMNTKEKKWFRSGKFEEETFKEDLEKIEEFYKNNGFADASVLSYDINYPGKGEMEIIINISEGKKYYFGNYSFQCVTIFTEDSLKRSSDLV